MVSWSPSSWQAYAYEQAARYPDEAQLCQVIETISHAPPLIPEIEINRLKQAIALAGQGKAFILQGGDCAESFEDCRLEIIHRKLDILFKMSQILFKGLQKPIIRIGRIAGQYAKPRSEAFETLNGLMLPSYRGDLVNLSAFNQSARTPNPSLLLQGYHCAAKTLDIIRHASNNDIYTSHEALHLHYEQALTRRMPNGTWYNTSTHLPWIGLRTAQPGSAHLELIRGIQNPVGIKIGANTSPAWLIQLLQLINPNQEEGRVLLITRMGAQPIHQTLPALIDAVQKTNHPVTWACDPMHGNTEMTPDGIKTRHFETIFEELQAALQIHHRMGSYLGGIHLELTYDKVTECLGGSQNLKASDLNQAYHSLLDPRLNDAQSLEMSERFSQAFMRYEKPGSTHAPHPPLPVHAQATHPA